MMQAISGEVVTDLTSDDEDEDESEEEDEGTHGARISEFGACLLFVTEQVRRYLTVFES